MGHNRDTGCRGTANAAAGIAETDGVVCVSAYETGVGLIVLRKICYTPGCERPAGWSDPATATGAVVFRTKRQGGHSTGRLSRSLL